MRKTASRPTGSSRWVERGGMRGWVAVLLLGAWAGVARGEVGLEIQVPTAGTHVLGDATPLLWRFTNRGPQPLGFMWEGCCRLNGRLTVTREGAPVEAVPPSQALAHMFAKADRLEPGVPREYETRVSDWVHLPGTGTYQLQGVYRGVLSNQFPQLQRGLALWREAAQSGAVTFSVLSVEDYLKQRPERERQRGLSLALEGDSRLPALKPALITATVSNALPEPVVLRWPEDFSLWIVDRDGRRIAPSVVLNEASTNWVIPGRGSVSRGFQITPDRMEGEPLGDHRMFLDLAGTADGRPRVPSAARALGWRLERGEVLDLVEAAARGAGTGARNAPLKLLRVYCGDVTEALAQASQSSASPEARALAARLHVAARLKPVAPVPGLVRLAVRPSPKGGWSWADERVGKALDRGDWAPQWDQVMAVRRDLGWDVQLEILPDEGAEVAAFFPELTGLRDRAAAAGHALMTGVREAAPGVAPVQVRWTDGARSSAGWVLSIGADDWAVSQTQGNDPSQAVARGTEAAELARRLTGMVQSVGRGEVPLMIGKGVSWGRVRALLESASPPGVRWDLAVRADVPNR